MSFLTRQWLLPFVVVLVVLLDQISKWIVILSLLENQSIAMIPGFFHLTLIHNKGIAFGLFHEGAWLLLAAIFLGILVLIFLAYKTRQESFLFRMSFAFVLGGAIGNLIDRLARGAVVDFLDFRIWPVFNLADSFITVGVFILIVTLLKGRHAS